MPPSTAAVNALFLQIAYGVIDEAVVNCDPLHRQRGKDSSYTKVTEIIVSTIYADQGRHYLSCDVALHSPSLYESATMKRRRVSIIKADTA